VYHTQLLFKKKEKNPVAYPSLRGEKGTQKQAEEFPSEEVG
jgi:hypothetical protein